MPKSQKPSAVAYRVRVKPDLKGPAIDRLYSLGMPRDGEPFHRIVQGEWYHRRYKDYFIDALGIRGAPPPADADLVFRGESVEVYRNGSSFDPRLGGWHWLHISPNGETISFYVWRIRLVYFKVNVHSPPYLEQLWDGHKAVWWRSIQNIGNANTEMVGYIKKLAEGMLLLDLVSPKNPGGYPPEEIEQMITDTIERMAQEQRDKPQVKKFTVTNFSKAWNFHIGRTTIYNYVSKERLEINGEIEKRYMARCVALRSAK